MDSDRELAGQGYLEHLTDHDLVVLATAVGDWPDQSGRLRTTPAEVVTLIGRPEVYQRVYSDSGLDADGGGLLLVSPFCAFAVAVHRAADELSTAQFVPERSAPRQRVPLFDVVQLREFLADPMRRLYLAELLASFVRVASGRYWTKDRRGWRTRRYSELDPVRLAGMTGTVPPAQRPGFYRRLGDVSLFLTGVFPDYLQLHGFGPFDAARLLRAAGLSDLSAEETANLLTAPPIQLLEYLGQRWYREAHAMVRVASVASVQMAVVAQVADRFTDARRVLNHITDQHLFPSTASWLRPPE